MTIFGAPVENTGTKQTEINADMVILPGGLLLVDQASPLADMDGLGRPISGVIYCDEKGEKDECL
jgi:hypothetical protein